MARPKKKIDPKQVESLAAINCSYEEMANILGCDPSTLTRRFAQDIQKGRLNGKMSLKRKMWDRAMKGDGNTGMLIWLSKIMLGYKEQYILPIGAEASKNIAKKDFGEFCEDAGYPEPYPKQDEMRVFGMDETDARLLLGSRGYGKTDYVVIMGLAYKIYLDPNFTCLIVTKSSERNASILNEIASALNKNGVQLEKESASCIRVAGLRGKDHSVSAITIGTSSIRGRHPKIIIMDDPVTEEDVSEATRKRVQRVYNELFKLSPNILIIGQPVHKYDLYETLRPIIKKMEVPHGNIPELDHDLQAQRLAGVSEESIQASYFLKVIAQSATPLDAVKYIDDFPTGDSVAFIDPSFKGGDFTSLSIIKAYLEGVAVKGHCYKRAWNHCIDEMIDNMIACGVKRICIECNSLGDQPVQLIRQRLAERGITGIGVVGKDSTTNKHSRIMAAGIFAPLIHLAKTSDREYIDQTVKYEYGAPHDDAPDSLASGLEWVGLIRGKK